MKIVTLNFVAFKTSRVSRRILVLAEPTINFLGYFFPPERLRDWEISSIEYLRSVCRVFQIKFLLTVHSYVGQISNLHKLFSSLYSIFTQGVHNIPLVNQNKEYSSGIGKTLINIISSQYKESKMALV